MQQEEFLKKVQDYGGLESRDDALRITEVFFSTLGEWLYRTEIRKLATQLPKEFEDFFYKEQDPEQSPADVSRYKLEVFYTRIKARADIGYNEAVKLSKAAARVLQESVSPGEMEDVIQKLPDEFDKLFE